VPKARRKRAAPAGKTKARNIRLSDDVHDRLWLLARQRKQTVSAVADDLLNKALPRWDLKRLG
jgi:predicted transcriptional regulator